MDRALPTSRPGGAGPITDERLRAGHERPKATALVEFPLLMAAILLGTNAVVVKYTVSAIPPLPLVALRFVVAGLLLLGAVHLLRIGGGVGRKDLLAMVGVGVLGVGMINVLFTLGVGLTSASETSLLLAAVPVWGMILGVPY